MVLNYINIWMAIRKLGYNYGLSALFKPIENAEDDIAEAKKIFEEKY